MPDNDNQNTVHALKPLLPSSSLITSCTTCRWTGTVTFSGISLWLLYERSRIERHARAHRGILAVMSLGFASAAIVRWNL